MHVVCALGMSVRFAVPTNLKCSTYVAGVELFLPPRHLIPVTEYMRYTTTGMVPIFLALRP